MKKQVKYEIDICWMLRTLAEEWYLRCYKYQRTNYNVYPNIYSRERSFLFRGNSTIQFNHKKIKQTKQDRYFNETTEKWIRYKELKG